MLVVTSLLRLDVDETFVRSSFHGVVFLDLDGLYQLALSRRDGHDMQQPREQTHVDRHGTIKHCIGGRKGVSSPLINLPKLQTTIPNHHQKDLV